MNLVEFKNKKYWDVFVDLQKLTKERKQNEKNRQKYFFYKKLWFGNHKRELEKEELAKKIIW
jgi:hypothetical protein